MLDSDRMGGIAEESFESTLEYESPGFQEWIANQNLSEKEMILWLFHRWMRQQTDLDSGTIVDYRKYVAGKLNKDGTLIPATNESREISRHEQAAINKFKEFRDFHKNANAADDHP